MIDCDFKFAHSLKIAVLALNTFSPSIYYSQVKIRANENDYTVMLNLADPGLPTYNLKLKLF
jgi:hypothetical protein